MMKSLILAFVVFAFAKAHADDTLNLFTFSTGGNSLQTNERYNVSKQQMLNVPLWNPETDAAPLEFSRALKLAKNWLRAKGADKICLTDYAVRSV
ncbi:MAG: hypothetical protein ACXV9Q_00690, partial [Chthoniobacterales bacterium]